MGLVDEVDVDIDSYAHVGLKEADHPCESVELAFRIVLGVTHDYEFATASNQFV